MMRTSSFLQVIVFEALFAEQVTERFRYCVDAPLIVAAVHVAVGGSVGKRLYS